jgi:hypothetical protein
VYIANTKTQQNKGNKIIPHKQSHPKLQLQTQTTPFKILE